jgi:hypothetical protein
VFENFAQLRSQPFIKIIRDAGSERDFSPESVNICHYTVSDVTGSIFRYAISSVLAKKKLEKLRVRSLSNNKEEAA